MKTAVLKTTVGRCPRCGGSHSTPLTPNERVAVANGWDLASYRWAIEKLKTSSGTRLSEPRSAAARDAIPPAPDQHQLVRERLAQGTPSIRISGTPRLAADVDGIPPAPDQHALVRRLQGVSR